MGYIAHDAVIVTISDYVFGTAKDPHVEQFRDEMPEEHQHLLIGPIRGINGYTTWFFGPDGSKEGWRPSDQAEELRSKFAELFEFRHEDGSSPFDVVDIRFGGDDYERVEAVDPRVGWIVRG